jgi:hypothetical protein
MGEDRAKYRLATRAARWRRAMVLAMPVTLGLLLVSQGTAGATASRPAAGEAAAGSSAARASADAVSNLSAANCAALSGLSLPNTTVDLAQADTSGSFTIPAGQLGAGSVITGLPQFCEVSLTETNPPATDKVNIEVWLPLQGWNRRFQGVGGGGFVSGISWNSLAPALQAGYATASTDTGHPASQSNGSFALNSDGSLNWPEIDDFAYRGIHEMTVDAKAVIDAFYGANASYSYFNGCSTGGRQALMEAQRYPRDYNGILAGSPAINWSKFMVAQIWPEFVMKQLGDYLPQCKLAAFRQAAISACEVAGGVNYGEIMNPADCRFNPYSLVGESTPCGTITTTDAQAVELITRGETASFPQGRFLWYGLEPGTDFSGLANTTTTSGVTSPSPLSISVEWFQYWLTRNPDFNWESLTIKDLDRFFVQSETEFAVMETDNPDLARFRDAGGKIVIWTGLADQLIFPQGAVQYYQQVIRTMGGLTRTQSFARLFLAPGNGHCGGDSVGPVPSNQFSALTSWVENGTAPATLLASATTSSGATETRPLCAYPDGAVYNGTGSLSDAASFHCALVFRGPPG